MRSQIAQFLDHVSYERGLSANTREAYESDLTSFADFLGARFHVDDFAHVTRGHVAAFLDAQRRQGMRGTTRARRLVAIKVFFAFLFAEGQLASNVTEVVASLAKGRRLPRTLSEKTVAALLDSITGNSARDVRDRCMLELFYACGLRVSELTGLRVEDVRLDEGLVRCVGKGDKQRLIPLGGRAAQWVRRYLACARPVFAKGGTGDDALFLTRLGGAFTRQGVFDMLQKRVCAVALDVPVSPHVLRHCFASHLLAHGAQIRSIQEMLGHADIATTQIYTHVDERQVTRTHALFHPRH